MLTTIADAASPATCRPSFVLSSPLPLQHAPVVKALLVGFGESISVLEQNEFGQGALTNAYSMNNAVIVSMLLSHSSAAALEAAHAGAVKTTGTADGAVGGASSGASAAASASAGGEQKAGATGTAGPGAGADDDATAMPADSEIIQAHTHELAFDAAATVVYCREVALRWTGDAFDSNKADKDVTGVNLWPAALVLSRWLVAWCGTEASAGEASADEAAVEGKAGGNVEGNVEGSAGGSFAGRVVCELGAGCGLPGIVARVLGGAERVVLTDYFPHTVANLAHNIHANACAENVSAAKLDWADKSTWDDDLVGSVDVIVGSDLVYQESCVPDIVSTVDALLKHDAEAAFM